MIIKKEKDTIDDYLSDASNYKGDAEIVCIPETREELREIISESSEKKQRITISGARTGLTGGAAPQGGTVISTEKLNRIIEIDENKKTVTVEPGVTLEQLESDLLKRGCFYPPNPTEKLSTLGGNVSTNASGSRSFKYGPTRSFVESLKIILADGNELYLKRSNDKASGSSLTLQTGSDIVLKLDIPSIIAPDIKNAAGFFMIPDMDAVDLFIGSEGTLGVVSEIELAFNDIPEAVLGGIVFFEKEPGLFDFVDYCRKESNLLNLRNYREMDSICARLIEYFDSNALDILRKEYTQIPASAIGAIWFEQEYTPANEDKVLESWTRLINTHTTLANETWVALNENEHERIREFRHKLPLALNEITMKNRQRKIATDTAVPATHFMKMQKSIKEIMVNTGLDHVVFGHIGNCHLHANFFVRDEAETEQAILAYEEIITKSLELGGTVSAEHGIGKLKKKYLRMMYGKKGIEQMKQVKMALDPECLLGFSTLFD